MVEPGHVVRIGPDTVSFDTISALKEIYGSRNSNVQKAEWYRILDIADNASSTHSEVDHVNHAKKRRILGHAFSPAAIQSAEPFVLQNVQLWIEQLGKGKRESDGWVAPVDMRKWSNYLAYDIMGDLSFGKKYDCIVRDLEGDSSIPAD
jgi:cytochrome P450